jgi:uncharacterized protein YyaL (SSP411 family)
MMRFFIPLICLITLFSCSKEKRYTKALKGIWQIELVKLQDNEGFSFFDKHAVGSLVIDDDQLVSGAIYSSFAGNSGQLMDTFQLAGHYFLTLKNEEINFVLGQDTLKARLLLLTNTDLEFEYYNALKSKRVRYIFKKV